MESLLLTIKEAAALCGYSYRTMQRMIQAGDIRSVRWGSTVRVTRKAIEEFIADREAQKDGVA